MLTKGNKAEVLTILGTRVNMLEMDQAIERLEAWITGSSICRRVVVTGMHGIMQAKKSSCFQKIVNSADLFVPDGISLIWIGMIKGFRLRRRVTGSELMWTFFRVADAKGYSSFFYGDTEDTLALLSEKVQFNFPNHKIAGVISPPFTIQTPEAEERDLKAINESGADVLWGGLGLPKQEEWIFRNRGRLTVPVAIGVGASFKFLSGQVMRAPDWVGRNGMEWLWRLITEPRIVWRRIFLDGPCFMFFVLQELVGLRKYK